MNKKIIIKLIPSYICFIFIVISSIILLARTPRNNLSMFIPINIGIILIVLTLFGLMSLIKILCTVADNPKYFKITNLAYWISFSIIVLLCIGMVFMSRLVSNGGV
jgi:hypothetical protein